MTELMMEENLPSDDHQGPVTTGLSTCPTAMTCLRIHLRHKNFHGLPLVNDRGKENVSIRFLHVAIHKFHRMRFSEGEGQGYGQSGLASATFSRGDGDAQRGQWL